MKKIIKLFVKCICVMFPAIAMSIFAGTNLLSFADQEVPYYLWNKEICNTKQDKEYKVLILGDSASNGAYAPEILSDSTLNLAMGGTTALGNYYVLKEYLAHHETPEVIYLSFDDAHMWQSGSFEFIALYSQRFQFDELSEMISRAKFYQESSIITGIYKTDLISYALYLPNKYITSMMNGGFNQRKAGNLAAWQMTDLHRGRYISLSDAEKKDTGQTVSNSFTVAPLFDEYYKKIIELCAENNIRVRAVKLPVDENTEFTDQYKTEFWAYYSRLQQAYGNLTVDWIQEPDRHFYFQDMVHMNNRGARVFSEKIRTMYPGDFQDEISTGQMAAMDHDIQMETDLCELFQWISGKDYTMLLYDGTGSLETVYDEELKSGFGLKLLDSGFENMYYVSGMKSGDVAPTVDDTDGSYQVSVDGENRYEWKPILSDGLGVCIMNNRTGEQVCAKNFLRVLQGFRIQE